MKLKLASVDKMSECKDRSDRGWESRKKHYSYDISFLKTYSFLNKVRINTAEYVDKLGF